MIYLLSDSDYKRFLSKIYQDENGILRWCGAFDTNGYGLFYFKGKHANAHRIAFDLWGDEEITPDSHVLHKIDDRDIVDARFLFLGTAADNARDRNEKGRQARGVNQGSSRLNEEQVLEIYERVWNGETNRALAMEFGISHTSVQHIKQGRLWSWLTGHKQAA